MIHHSRGMLGASVFFSLILSACGPVKFSSSSEDTSVTPTTTTLRDVQYNHQVSASNNKLDIVLVIDDSSSMLPDNQKLAANLSGFISKLQSSNIDWQMCATVTRALPVSESQMAWGASIYWQKYTTPSNELGMVLKKGTPNLSSIFVNTIEYINAGWVGSDDERAIKAAYRHVYNGDLRYSPNSGCYRADSAIAYIIISDEDERSIGGDASQQVYSGELKTLEDEDKPSVFAAYVKEVFGNNRRFTVNSIIVKPGDSTCKSSQDSSGAKSHYGVKYAELSNLTGGGIGSICDTDYSANMNLFVDKISDSLGSIPLECAPHNGAVTVNVSPTFTTQSRVEGMNLILNPSVPAGYTVNLKYQCADRNPSSLGGATPATEGFFAKIVSFFKNLF